MQKKRTLFLGLAAVLLLILDSATAAEAAEKSLKLCGKTLIPGLFPMFVLCAATVPHLSEIRLRPLSRLLGLPDGSEGIFLLGCAGGFPLGAACIAQGVRDGGLCRTDGERMLGLCSFCGPGFLFGVMGTLFSMEWAMALFCIQLEAALALGVLWPGKSTRRYEPPGQSISLPEAVQRSIRSMLSVCAWVMLAGVVAGLLEKHLFPLLPKTLGLLLTGLLELTNGVFSVGGQTIEAQIILCTIFACFGGISVLLQIAALAAPAGLGMGQCLLQKAAHALLGALLALGYLHWGNAMLIPIPGFLLWKSLKNSSGNFQEAVV